jgi:hypothetical protein
MEACTTSKPIIVVVFFFHGTDHFQISKFNLGSLLKVIRPRLEAGGSLGG